MRLIHKLLPALLLSGAAFGAAAQGAYIVGSAGQSSWDFGCGPNGCNSSTSALRLAAGYRFNRLVALEAFYVNFGSARSSDFSINGEIAGRATGLQTLLGWQWGPVDLAGKIGAASVRADFRPSQATAFTTTQSANHTEVIGGLMGAWHLTPNLAIRLDIDVVTVAIDSNAVFFTKGANVTTTSLGLMFNF